MVTDPKLLKIKANKNNSKRTFYDLVKLHKKRWNRQKKLNHQKQIEKRNLEQKKQKRIGLNLSRFINNSEDSSKRHPDILFIDSNKSILIRWKKLGSQAKRKSVGAKTPQQMNAETSRNILFDVSRRYSKQYCMYTSLANKSSSINRSLRDSLLMQWAKISTNGP